MNLHDLRQHYIGLGLDIIQNTSAQREIVLDLLHTLLLAYKQDIANLPKKMATGNEENLIPLNEVHKKLRQSIADELGYSGVKITTIEKLVDLIFPIGEEIKATLETPVIPEPDIQGSIEQLNMIIFPPDEAEIITGSGAGREQREIVGYDKIGLIEGWIADQIQIQRKDIHRKTGILEANQMRKVSYYFTYIPQWDVTIITNNQYGEGTFVVQGERPYYAETKKANKGGPDFIPVKFNYNDPEDFLVRLGVVVRTIKGMTQELPHTKTAINHQQREGAEAYSQEEIIPLLQTYRTDFISMGTADRQTRSLKDSSGKKIISYIDLCRLFGYKEDQKDLYKDTIFHPLCEKLFGLDWRQKK